jgi:hypothetical protein
MHEYFTCIRPAFLLALVTVLPGGIVAQLCAEERVTLAYRLQPGQVFGYEVKIEADRGPFVEFLAGNVLYQVAAAQDAGFQLKFAGGIQSRQVPKKQGTAVRPLDAARRSPLSPLSGLGRTNNEIEISKTGEVLSLQGSSQLPYLLGDLSLLPLEMLPGDARSAWSVEMATGIAESGERVSRPRVKLAEKRTSGSETTSYEIEQTSETEATIRKTF